MKIGFAGLELPEGKIKYNDKILEALSLKDQPKKVSPFYVDFRRDEFDRCDAIVIAKDSLLDLLIYDMEKMERRLARLEDGAEKTLLQRCLEALEQEVPLCDLGLTEQERDVVAKAAPFSLKPVIQVDGDVAIDEIIATALDSTGHMFFYTSGPSEAHAWLVGKDATIVSCAAAIHTDLARGFIKGDVVSFDDYMNCHSFNDCKSRGLARLVDRDYVVQPGEIIEIRFNVKR